MENFTTTNEKKIYIIHENHEWLTPLKDALEELELPYEEWFVNQGTFDVQNAPPEGVFYNRMSASSHTRDHRFAVELSEPVLAWLSAWGRKVINDRRALSLETRKLEQYIALNRYGVRTPFTIAAVGKDELVRAARELNKTPFIVKPNRGGKGTAVTLYNSISELEANLHNYHEFSSLDGINLVQEFIKSKDQSIVRMEFIGGKFYYATRVDASNGFELCPADPCANKDDKRFEIIKDYHNPEILQYERFLTANGIHIAAIEYIEDENGLRYAYDVNINTNYNPWGEARAENKYSGMKQIASWLGKELEKLRQKEAMENLENTYNKVLFTA